MAMTPIYDGPVLVRIDAGAGLESLGYTEDGVDWDYQDRKLPVHGDENGGADGAPIDVQELPGIYIVHMTLTKYDPAVWDKVEALMQGGTAGQANSAGTLLFTEGKSFRLLLSPTSRPRNFLRAIPTAPAGNKAVKHSKPTVVWECHKNASGLYYNTSTG